MYEYIRGQVANREPGSVVVEAGGIGYRIFVTGRTAQDLPATEAMVFLHERASDEGLTLFGFQGVEERSLFRTLLKVKGVGPRGALAVLDGTTRQEFLRAIANRDVKALVRIKGIGKKTAERILVELGDRLPESPLEDDLARGPIGISESAVQALQSLGLERKVAESTIDTVLASWESEPAGGDLEELVRAALQTV